MCIFARFLLEELIYFPEAVINNYIMCRSQVFIDVIIIKVLFYIGKAWKLPKYPIICWLTKYIMI